MSQDQIPHALSSVTDQPIVEARFHLTAITAKPAYNREYGTGKMVQIEMSAAKHGTFGKASPNGTISMMIQNPGAYKLFEAAFNEALDRVPVKDKATMMTSRWRVYFVLDEDQEADKY